MLTNPLLVNLLAVLSFLFLTSCSQGEPQVFQWKLQSQALASSVDYQEIEVLAQDIATMSSGRLVITPYSAGEFAHGPDIFNAVSDNKVQMGNGWPNWWAAQHPSWALLNAGPFDFMNLDASMMFFFEKGGMELANELSLPKGVLWRPAWWAGMEFGLTSKELITGLDDLRGKRVRIGPGLPSEVLAEAAGSMSIPLVPEEIRPSLQRGVLDAVEWTTAAGIIDLGLHDLSPYGIVPAIWQPSVLADFLINKQAYDQLPPDLRQILETAIKSYTLTTTLKAKNKDIESLSIFEKRGMSLRKWSEEDINRWRIAADKVLAQYENRDPFSKRVIDEKKAFKVVYNQYYTLFGPYD